MKKLLIIILLLFSVSVSAQSLETSWRKLLNLSNTWTQPQTIGNVNNFISQFAVGQDTNSTNINGVFNFVNTRYNTNRSTLAQSTDTSSFSLKFTKSGKPILSLKNETGKEVFAYDSASVVLNSSSIGLNNSTYARNFYPQATNYYDFGDYANKWRNIHVNSINLKIDSTVATGDSCYIGRHTLMVNIGSPSSIVLSDYNVAQGQIYIVKNLTANAITVTSKTGNNIEGGASVSLGTQNEAMTFQYRNKSWWIINHYKP